MQSESNYYRKDTYEKCTLPQTRLLTNEETGVQGGRLLFWEESQLPHFSNYDVATVITASSVAFIGVISFIGVYKQKVN